VHRHRCNRHEFAFPRPLHLWIFRDLSRGEKRGIAGSSALWQAVGPASDRPCRDSQVRGRGPARFFSPRSPSASNFFHPAALHPSESAHAISGLFRFRDVGATNLSLESVGLSPVTPGSLLIFRVSICRRSTELIRFALPPLRTTAGSTRLSPLCPSFRRFDRRTKIFLSSFFLEVPLLPVVSVALLRLRSSFLLYAFASRCSEEFELSLIPYLRFEDLS